MGHVKGKGHQPVQADKGLRHRQGTAPQAAQEHGRQDDDPQQPVPDSGLPGGGHHGVCAGR